MTASKHPKGGREPGDGLGADTPLPPSDDTPGRTNPGIATSKGAFATGAPSTDVAGQNFQTGTTNDPADQPDQRPLHKPETDRA